MEAEIQELTERLQAAKDCLEKLNKIEYNITNITDNEIIFERFSNEGDGLILEDRLQGYFEEKDKLLFITIIDAYQYIRFALNKEMNTNLIYFLINQQHKFN